jgi:hypothetical protein
LMTASSHGVAALSVAAAATTAAVAAAALRCCSTSQILSQVRLVSGSHSAASVAEAAGFSAMLPQTVLEKGTKSGGEIGKQTVDSMTSSSVAGSQ